MMNLRVLLLNLAALLLSVLLSVALFDAITSPTYQEGLTARYTAQQETRQVEAREWGETARTWGQWGAGALGVAVVALVAGWAVVRWQGERTRREELQQSGATERLRIGAQRDVALAWIAQHGTAGSYAGELEGVGAGVFVPERREFIPLAACEAQLVGPL
jgi:hypothetical protein